MPVDFGSADQKNPPREREGAPPQEIVQQTYVQWATASQKEEIIRLLNHPLITRQEKVKMLLNINRLTEDYATNAIRKMRKSIEDRESGVEQVPEHKVLPTDERTYTFYELQRCASAEVSMRDRVYPKRVREDKMTQQKADSETEMMGRLATIMHGLSTGTLRLVHVSSGKQIHDSQPGSFDRYIDIH